jgi:TetR/AcrR family transcriptional repressor of nem operon
MDAVLNVMWTGSYGSTTVDLICEKARVKKGSLYYFFESKAELATAALECDWQARRGQIDALFSAATPPSERIRRFCEHVYRKQAALKNECGCVLGCYLYALGADICTGEQQVRSKVREILAYHRKYMEIAIRDADAEHLINAANVAEKARMVQAYYEGLPMQARIQNDAEVLRELPCGVFAILGLSSAEQLAA